MHVADHPKAGRRSVKGTSPMVVFDTAVLVVGDAAEQAFDRRASAGPPSSQARRAPTAAFRA